MTPLLEFDRVSKWFRDTVAVGDMSFALAPGVTGLLGHNGAGKSTAIRLATGLARPDEGTVRINGLDPRRSGAARAAIGLVPDGDGLWPGLTARGLVEACARLRGVSDARGAAAAALPLLCLLFTSLAAGPACSGSLDSTVAQIFRPVAKLVHARTQLVHTAL